MNIIQKIINLVSNRKYKAIVNRLDTTIDDKDYTKEIKKVINLLSYTRKSGVSYSGTEFITGYHSLDINNYHFKGQRNPQKRFKNLPISLKGKSVLDIGCNQGGMLYTFSKEIKYGIGIDYDTRMINAANKIKSYTNSTNLDFYVFDLEKEPLSYINDFLPEDKVDIVLLLAICMWIKNWKEVIDFSVSISNMMIFETNGKPEQQNEQIDYLKQVYKNVNLINKKSEDDATQKNRQLYYCY